MMCWEGRKWLNVSLVIMRIWEDPTLSFEDVIKGRVCSSCINIMALYSSTLCQYLTIMYVALSFQLGTGYSFYRSVHLEYFNRKLVFLHFFYQALSFSSVFGKWNKPKTNYIKYIKTRCLPTTNEDWNVPIT